MPTCIYCAETKSAQLFNRDHVVPESFGTFEHNFVLDDKVCQACNSRFGDSIERQLGRASLEGLDRFEHGVRLPDAGTHIGAEALEARLDIDGPYSGAIAEWGAAPDGIGLVLVPVPQIGIGKEVGVVQEWFRLSKLPRKQDLYERGFQPGTSISITTLAVSPKDAEARLAALGYEPRDFGEVGGPFQVQGSVPIRIRSSIGHPVMRAVAKIAINYLAYIYGAGLVLLPQFAAARSYVRSGTTVGGCPVSVTTEPIIGNVFAHANAHRLTNPGAYRLLGHTVAVAWRDDHVLGQVSLFSRVQYRVTLSAGGFTFPPTHVRSGHFFDPRNHRIRPLSPP